MEARLIRAAFVAAALLSLGASHRTTNFIVTAPTPQLAQEVCTAAEQYRHQLAIDWLGKPLPRWSQPCPINVHCGPQLGAGGATSFVFERGVPFGWQMTIQGSRERLLDSVLPHEVTHTIFATHFGRPLPRWADEGGATSVEHISEKQKHQRMLIEFLTTNRGIAFNKMYAMREYPDDILPLYAQGHSLAEYLIARGGRHRFIQYVGDGMDTGDWGAASRTHYGIENLSEMQLTWVDWVRRGCPPVTPDNTPPTAPDAMLAAATTGATGNAETAVQQADARAAAPPVALATAEQPARVVEVDENGLSWYTQQRNRGPAGNRAAMHSTAGATSGPIPGGSLSRPQPAQTPRQVILEWSRSPATAPAPAAPIYDASRGPAMLR